MLKLRQLVSWFAGFVLLTTTFAGVPPISRAQNQVEVNTQVERQSSSQISILLMGIDEHQLDEGAAPTNTMVVLSLNPAENSGTMLFLPHNLWVAYPAGYGEGLISQANIIGDALDYPGGGGPEMATQTVSALLGIPIQHYLIINFESFIAFFEVIGKIEVCPSEHVIQHTLPNETQVLVPVPEKVEALVEGLFGSAAPSD